MRRLGDRAHFRPASGAGLRWKKNFSISAGREILRPFVGFSAAPRYRTISRSSTTFWQGRRSSLGRDCNTFLSALGCRSARRWSRASVTPARDHHQAKNAGLDLSLPVDQSGRPDGSCAAHARLKLTIHAIEAAWSRHRTRDQLTYDTALRDAKTVVWNGPMGVLRSTSSLRHACVGAGCCDVKGHIIGGGDRWRRHSGLPTASRTFHGVAGGVGFSRRAESTLGRRMPIVVDTRDRSRPVPTRLGPRASYAKNRHCLQLKMFRTGRNRFLIIAARTRRSCVRRIVVVHHLHRGGGGAEGGRDRISPSRREATVSANGRSLGKSSPG